MDAGGLRHKVTIQQKGAGQDDFGQPNAGWTDFASNIWAKVLFLNGLEYIKSDKEAMQVSGSVRIRNRPGITTAMRLIHKSIVYDIKAVLPDGQNEYIDLAVSLVQ